MKTIESLKQSILNKIALIKGFAINILNKLAEENAGFIGHTVAKIAEDILGLFGEIDTLTGNPNIAQYRVRKYTMDVSGSYGNPVEEIHSWMWGEVVSVDTKTLSPGFAYDRTHPGYNATGVVNEDNSTVFDVYIKRNTYTLTLNYLGGSLVINGQNIPDTYSLEFLYGAAVWVTNYIPLQDGYTFSTWSPSVPTTMPAENITTSAVWLNRFYTISWNVDGVIKQHTCEVGS